VTGEAYGTKETTIANNNLPVVSPYSVTASNITWNMYKENVVEGPGQDVLAIDNGAPAQSYTIPAPTITVEQNTGGADDIPPTQGITAPTGNALKPQLNSCPLFVKNWFLPTVLEK